MSVDKKPKPKFKKKHLLPFNVIRNILKSIDPRELQNYHNWLKIVFCVKGQIPGGIDADKKIKDKYFDLIDTFCKGMNNYDQKQIISIIFSTDEVEQEYGLPTWKDIVINYSSNPNILDLIDPINDKSAADIYLKSYGDYHLLFNYERWDYDDNTGLWRCPPKGDRKIQMRYAQNLTELREYSEEHSKMKNMLSMVDPNIKEIINEKLKRKYEFTLKASDLNKEVDEQLKKEQPSIQMKGFRKGKVPISLSLIHI